MTRSAAAGAACRWPLVVVCLAAALTAGCIDAPSNTTDPDAPTAPDEEGVDPWDVIDEVNRTTERAAHEGTNTTRGTTPPGPDGRDAVGDGARDAPRPTPDERQGATPAPSPRPSPAPSPAPPGPTHDPLPAPTGTPLPTTSPLPASTATPLPTTSPLPASTATPRPTTSPLPELTTDPLDPLAGTLPLGTTSIV